MINWIRNKLHNFIFPEREADRANTLVSSSDDMGYDADNSLRFQLTNARGGIILSMRKYDEHRDRTYYQNYVIPDGEDTANSVAQIVSMEMLRNSS